MTFKTFESIFLSKYPDGSVFAHGAFGPTEKNRKVAVTFTPDGLVYEYYGAYEDVLTKMGFKVISKARLMEMETRLADYTERNGQDDFFGGSFDYTNEIKTLSSEIEAIKANYIVA